jgi:hypothetical protein
MKPSQIALLVIGFILISLMATNPSIEDHRIAVFDEMKEKMSSSSSSVSTNEWQKAGEAIGFAIGKGILENAVSRENYVLFSLTKITINGNQKNIGIGILGNVLVNNEILNSGNELSTNLNSTNSLNIEQNSNTGFPGIYPQSSARVLFAADLEGLSHQELKIMRNEIYARHGYIFKTSEMKAYFSQQVWYQGQYEEVASQLTSIEQKNVELIKSYE